MGGLLKAPRTAGPEAMHGQDCDDPETEERWCASQRAAVTEYLRSQGLRHGAIGEWPAWHLAPLVSVWAIESLARPGWIGWWAISGDLPTDYLSAADMNPPQHPRKAIRALAERWLSLVHAWEQGRDSEEMRITGPHPPRELAPLLAARAKLLLEWTEDDSLWEA
jgi:hypothetical protein